MQFDPATPFLADKGLSDDVIPETLRHTVATMLCADSTVPEREIVELLGCEGKLPRATRIYAKHDPARLSNVTRALTTIGTDVHRAAKAFGAVHLLPTEGQGGKNGAIFTEKTIKSLT